MKNLRRLRKNAGLSMEEMAQELGITRQTLAAWETGQSWPSAAMLPRIAQMLGCGIGDLYDTENHNREEEI